MLSIEMRQLSLHFDDLPFTEKTTTWTSDIWWQKSQVNWSVST